MSELRSAIEEFRAITPAELPDALVEEYLLELHDASERIERERLRFLAEAERRQLYARDGYLSAASWLAATRRVGWGTAKRDVVFARALEQMPRTCAGLEDGDISLAAARMLAVVRETDPEVFSRDEELLVQAARRHSIAELQKVTAYWRQRVEHERFENVADALRERRRLHASRTIEGMVRLDGDLDPETGESLLTALHAMLDAEARGADTAEDRRTPAQRRADALGEICRGWLDRSDRPIVAGARPHVTLTVGVETLRQLEDTTPDPGATRVGSTTNGPELPAAAELAQTGRVSSEVARRILCDASIRRVVLAGRSEPLDVGRQTPVVPAALRTAVVMRDHHCRFPGCDRPQGWCDAHHVSHWADGGRTCLSNLLLLCRRHHGLVHERGGFTLVIEDGRPVFRRPDGSVLEDRAPPGCSDAA